MASIYSNPRGYLHYLLDVLLDLHAEWVVEAPSPGYHFCSSFRCPICMYDYGSWNGWWWLHHNFIPTVRGIYESLILNSKTNLVISLHHYMHNHMNLSFQDKLKLIPTCSVLIVKELYIVWNSPPKDTFKINVNESHIFHEKSCSCCCITRDSLDCCIKDFKLEPLLWLLRYGICYMTFVLQDNFQPLHATWKYTQRCWLLPFY